MRGLMIFETFAYHSELARTFKAKFWIPCWCIGTECGGSSSFHCSFKFHSDCHLPGSPGTPCSHTRSRIYETCIPGWQCEVEESVQSTFDSLAYSVLAASATIEVRFPFALNYQFVNHILLVHHLFLSALMGFRGFCLLVLLIVPDCSSSGVSSMAFKCSLWLYIVFT